MLNTMIRHGLTCAGTLGFALITSTLTAQTMLPDPGVPQSVGVQLKGHNFDLATIDTVRESGFTIVRRGIYWNAVEKEKGVYDFSDFDEQFNHAKKHGMRVVACLFSGNKLYEDNGKGGIQTQAGREGFAAFAAAAAKHYKDHNLLWEIWNEPNVRTFWRKDGMHNSDEFAQEYTDLVKAVAPAMLEADPGAFIMAGSVSNYWQPSYEWTESCFKKGILQTGIRGWSVHPYGVRTPEEFAIGHQKTRDLLKQYGAPDMPMLNTERGFAIQKPQGQLEQEGWSGGELGRLREYQAAQYVRQFMVDQLHGVVFTVWYEWDGDEFGLVARGQGDEIRPALAAARFMASRLDGYRLERRIDTGHPLDYLLEWIDGSGNRQLIAWTAPPPGGSPDEARPHDVIIATTGSGQFELADLYGKTTTIDQLKLTLSGSPQYVALPKGVQLGEVTTEAPKPVVSVPQGPAPEGQDLNAMGDPDAWTFEKNTGEGAFTIVREGDEAIGVITYDFTNSQSRSTPYVLAHRPVEIGSAQQISFNVRSAIAQPLTFRIVDSTGQTLQFKQRVKGTGSWENIRFPLNRRLERWGGANDGTVHFPIKQLVLSVPRPSEQQLTGKVEYSGFIAVGAAGASAQPATPPATPVEAPVAGSVDLNLFAADSEWRFEKNTGEGTFELVTEADKAIGVVNYDFTNSQSQSTPYVLVSRAVEIASAQHLSFEVRTPVAQQLTFRVVDSTGQTLQFKHRTKGTGTWEPLRFPLNRRLERWGGANDGTVHFPIKQVVLSIPRPNATHLIGKVEYANFVAVNE